MWCLRAWLTALNGVVGQWMLLIFTPQVCIFYICSKNFCFLRLLLHPLFYIDDIYTQASASLLLCSNPTALFFSVKLLHQPFNITSSLNLRFLNLFCTFKHFHNFNPTNYSDWALLNSILYVMLRTMSHKSLV